VVAYVAGLSAPPGRRMGHAGAIIQAAGEAASEKVELLKDAGVAISPTPSEIGETVQATLAQAKEPA
jgi:malate-CoA ligase subunit alpha